MIIKTVVIVLIILGLISYIRRRARIYYAKKLHDMETGNFE